MKEYGTNVVGGTSPGKGGSTVDGLPFSTPCTRQWKRRRPMPPFFLSRQLCGRCYHGSRRCRNQTDYLYLRRYPYPRCNQSVSLHSTERSHADRAELPRFNFSGKSLAGILPGNVFKKGNVGVISRSGTLTYEIVTILQPTAWANLPLLAWEVIP